MKNKSYIGKINMHPFGKEKPVVKPFGDHSQWKSSSPLASPLIGGESHGKKCMKGGSENE